MAVIWWLLWPQTWKRALKSITIFNTIDAFSLAHNMLTKTGILLNDALPSPAPHLASPVCSTGRRPGTSATIMAAPGQWLASTKVMRTPVHTRNGK